MNGKRHYGQYRFPIMSQSTQGNLNNFRPELFERFVRSSLAGHYASNGLIATSHDADNVIATAMAEWKVFNGGGVHLFIHPDTVAVIEHATSKLDDWEVLRYTIGCDVGVIYSPGLPETMFFQPDDGSMGVATNDMGIFRVERDHEQGWAMTTDENHKALARQLRLVCGVFMMMECFPQMFSDGLPEEFVKHPGWYRGLTAKGVCVSRIERSVCPHIRSGHFRLLSAERFTKKRGQVVFVRPSMVKGDAKHTEEAE